MSLQTGKKKKMGAQSDNRSKSIRYESMFKQFNVGSAGVRPSVKCGYDKWEGIISPGRSAKPST